MSITDEELILFKKMQTENPDIVLDGVVDEGSFTEARYRIVYILKEANGGKGWDLRKFLYDGGRPQTWDNIARWTEGILSLDIEFPWDEMEKNNEQRRKTMLKKIAALNLKKTSGGATSDGKEINAAAEYNCTVISKQLEIYHADIIVCCGTADAFVSACYSKCDVSWKMTSRGVWYFFDKNGTLIISFSHPAARVDNAYLFYALVDAVREIKTKHSAPAV